MLTSGPPSHRALAYQRGSQRNLGDAFGRVDMIEQPGGVAARSCQPRSNYFFNDDRKPHPAAFFLLTRRTDETDIAEIGRAHVLNPATNAHLVCLLRLEKHHTPVLN